MEQLELLARMACALRETIDILRDCHKISLLGQSCEGIMRRVGSDLEGHVSTVSVKLPDKPGAILERFWCSQFSGTVVAPETAGTTKGG